MDVRGLAFARQEGERHKVLACICHFAVDEASLPRLTTKYSRVFCEMHDAIHLVKIHDALIAYEEYRHAIRRWVERKSIANGMPHPSAVALSLEVSNQYLPEIVEILEDGRISKEFVRNAGEERNRLHNLKQAEEKQRRAEAKRKARQSSRCSKPKKLTQQKQLPVTRNKKPSSPITFEKVGEIFTVSYNGKRFGELSTTQAQDFYSCYSKKLYILENQAQRGQLLAGDAGLNIYTCPACTGFHLGHGEKRKEGIKARQIQRRWNMKPAEGRKFLKLTLNIDVAEFS